MSVHCAVLDMSTTNRVSRQPAFIIHRRPYRETSALVDLFTRDFGRVGAVHRGARGKKTVSPIQPMQPLLVDWSGRGDLKSINSAERVASNPALTGERLYSALYVNELLLRLLPPFDPHPELFEFYTRLLPSIALAEDIERVLREFELSLLSALGYAAELTRVAGTGDEPDPDGLYVYTPGLGLQPAIGTVGTQVSGSTLIAIAAGDLTDKETRRTAKFLMRACLTALLGGRPLASRELFLSRRVSDET